MRESKVERALVARVKSLGGDCEKFSSPGRRGVPDRIVLLPGGRIVFVELKAPGKQATKLQERDHTRRRALGFDVKVIDSLESANAFTG